MTYKRIYIALGSTAIEGMKNYILRLMEENIYSAPETKYFFLGIDSDINFLKTLQSLDLDREKIDTISLTLSGDDYTSRFVRAIHPNWPRNITGAGVGGDRRLSFTSLSWNSNLAEILDKLDYKLADKPDDKNDPEVYLIGSAFGGTSTGAFWNISYFIREHISNVKKNNVQIVQAPLFNSLLLFPQSQRFGEKSYPLGRNICAFLKEMQCLVWNRRLFEWKGKLTFKGINYSMLKIPKDKQSGSVPLFNDYGEDQTNTIVPFDTIYLIPTPFRDKRYQKEAVTEVLLILAELEIASQIPSFAVNLANGRLITKDEKFFGCFNIIMARNAKNTSCKKIAYEKLKSRWDAFQVSKSIEDNCDWVSKYIVKLMETEEDNASNKALYDRLKEIKGIDFKQNIIELRNALPKILLDIENLADTCPYKWPSKDELMKALAKAISDNDAPGTICLDDIIQAYNNNIELIKSMSEATASIKIKMNEFAEKASKIISRRKVSKIAKVLNAAKIVQKEVEEKLASGLSQILDEYLRGCRNNATVKLGRLTRQLKVEDFNSDAKFEEIKQTIDEALSVSTCSHAEFIYEDAGKNIDSNLQMLDTSKIKFNKPIINALSAELPEFDAIFVEFEKESIAIINKVASDKGAANPLNDMKTNLSINNLTPYIPAFSIAKTESYDYSFFIQNGAAQNTDGTPIKISDLNGKFPSFNKDIDSDYQKSIDKCPRTDQHWQIAPRNEQKISGIWAGTLTLDYSTLEILSKLYDKNIARTWANDAADDEKTDQYRLFTLKQSLLTGIILGVIEEKMRGNKNLTAINKLTIKIFKNDTDSFVLEPLKQKDIVACFETDVEGTRMIECKIEWLKGLFQWYEASFESDFDIKGADKLGGLLMFENSIFDSIGFAIPPDISDGLKALSAKLKERVKIELED